jgi:membrane fusion protein
MAEILVVDGQRVRAGDQLMVIHGDPGTGKNRDCVVKATQDGIVRNLRVRARQRVTRGHPLLQIISGEGRPFAELRLPADAIGSIAPGQGVNLALDAYPSETFGTVKARIVGISSRRIERSGTAGPLYVYLVKIRPLEPWIVVQGRKQALLPGMSVTARITTTRRRLLEWLAIARVRGTSR